MKHRKIIDLSVPLQQTPPDAVLKIDIQYIKHKEGAKVFGPMFGLQEKDFPEGLFSAVEKLTLTTHAGTHLDAPWHYWPTSEGKPSRTIDLIPLDWCYGDGVILDFTHKKTGEEIDAVDIQKALEHIGYTLKPLDIVLLMTGASKSYGLPEYQNIQVAAGLTPGRTDCCPLKRDV